MDHGGALARRRRPARRWRAPAVALLAATALSACAGDGGGRATDDDAAKAATPEVSGAAADPSPGSSERAIVECAELDPPRWRAIPTDADLPFEIVAGRAPGLGGGPAGQPDVAGVYRTPDEFLLQSNVADQAERKEVMKASGYRGGAEGSWTTGEGFQVQALTFADAPAAARYVEARVPSICGQGGTQEGVTLLDDGDGIMWIDPLDATHAEFIFGGSQVSLTSCGECRSVTLDDMQAWHDAFVEAYRTGPAAPIS